MINPFWAAIQLKIARDIAEDYLGETPPGFSPDRQLADPLTVMESGSVPVRPLPAIFAMTGTDDILLDDARRLETALRRRKAIHMVKYYPDEMHAFQFFYWRKQARRSDGMDILRICFKNIPTVQYPVIPTFGNF